MHAVNETHIDDLCPSCKQQHRNEWHDEWHGYVHYQVTNCPHCDFEIFKKSEIITSGKF